MADLYARQLTIIRIEPFPDIDHEAIVDELPPAFRKISEDLDIKMITKETTYTDLFYRSGLKIKSTGNYRIIYCVHNYYKIVLLHYFDKTYNGGIKGEDLIPAEKEYEQLCYRDPIQ